jgi:hypothetical protein
MVCMSGTGLVYLVSHMQPNKPDRPNRPNEQDSLLGLLDRFFDERLVGLCIKGHHGFTFRKITRSGEFVRLARLGSLDRHQRLFFDRQEGLLGVAEFFELTQRRELAQIL